MINFGEFSSELFQILKSYNRKMVLYDDVGNRVFEPEMARRFYLSRDNILLSIRDDTENSTLRLYIGNKIALAQVKGLMGVLRKLTTRFSILFQVKKFNKEIRPKDFATNEAINVRRKSNMDLLEGLYGTSKSSYLKLENAKMIVRHSHRVSENAIGSRGRFIKAIFVENAQGERQLFPVNTLVGAKAMTQHVNQGGTFADEIGAQIIRMTQDYRNLAQTITHGRRNDIPDATAYQAVKESLRKERSRLKGSLTRLGESASYLRESSKVVDGISLLEASENAIEAWVAVMGEGIDRTILATAARLVGLPQGENDLTEEVEEVEDQEELFSEENFEPIPAELLPENEDKQPKFQALKESPLATNNPVIREHMDWLKSFKDL